MNPHERQYLFDYLASGLAVMKQVKRVRSRGVIHECNRQIATQRLDQETVKRFVQVRHLVLTCSHNEQRQTLREIIG